MLVTHFCSEVSAAPRVLGYDGVVTPGRVTSRKSSDQSEAGIFPRLTNQSRRISRVPSTLTSKPRVRAGRAGPGPMPGRGPGPG